MLVTLLGTFIEVKDVQLSNVSLLIAITLSGIINVCNDLQFLNAEDPISITFDPNDIFVRLSQSMNAAYLIVVRLSGIDMDVNDEHEPNAAAPIVVILLLNVTFVKLIFV